MIIRWLVGDVHVLGAGNAVTGVTCEVDNALAVSLIAQGLAERVNEKKKMTIKNNVGITDNEEA